MSEWVPEVGDLVRVNTPDKPHRFGRVTGFRPKARGRSWIDPKRYVRVRLNGERRARNYSRSSLSPADPVSLLGDLVRDED